MCCRPWPTPARPSSSKSWRWVPQAEPYSEFEQYWPLALICHALAAIKSIVTNTSPTLAQALNQAHTLGLARIDAQLLLLPPRARHDAGRAWLLAHDTDAMEEAAHAQFIALCQRRLAGEPVAYLTGRKEFYGLPLQVDARADALAVAQANAQRLGLPARFQRSDWLRGVDGFFDAIISNPPYIASADPHLAALTHEPLQALASGADGLEDIRTIVAQAPAHLQPGGWLLLEHGYDQAEAVQALLATQGFALVQSRNDLAGIARCSGGQWPLAQTVK